jgi:hypothetical protein
MPSTTGSRGPVPGIVAMASRVYTGATWKQEQAL